MGQTERYRGISREKIQLEFVQNQLDRLVLLTPTGVTRERLTAARIFLIEAILQLANAEKLEAGGPKET
jgi:hypothetical protein